LKKYCYQYHIEKSLIALTKECCHWTQ